MPVVQVGGYFALMLQLVIILSRPPNHLPFGTITIAQTKDFLPVNALPSCLQGRA
jgi:hypothetical protein